MELEITHRSFDNYDEIISSPNFPEELKARIGTIDNLIAEHEQSPNEDLALKIKQQSAYLWHKIKDFTESELPEDIEETPPTPPVEDTPPAPLAEETPPAPPTEEVEEESYGRSFLRNKRT